jgi:hypothetical protein
MQPASAIIESLGGLTAASSVLGLSVHTIKRWRQPKCKGGTDGFIPREHLFQVHASLLGDGCDISAEELIYSPEQRAEIDALRLQSSPNAERSSSRKTNKFYGMGS